MFRRKTPHSQKLAQKGAMNSVWRFHRNSGVEQHPVRSLADSQGHAESDFAGDASLLASWPTSERSCSGSILEKERLMLMILQQEARVRTMHVPFHSSKQTRRYSIKSGSIKLFDSGHLCLVNQYENLNPLDESWLIERCGGDSMLVNEVLQTFCAQGLIHIDAMHQSDVNGDVVATLFHVVRPVDSDAKRADSTVARPFRFPPFVESPLIISA